MKVFLGTIMLGVIASLTLRNQILPNPKLTPGLVNPSISQENIEQNICSDNWSTKSIRPPLSYTNKLKARQIKEYGYRDTKLGNYEEDHLISLVLGGSPTDPRNLWPESYPNAREKDKVENYLHREVCLGKITLKEAQIGISQNWVLIYQNMPRTLGSLEDNLDPDDN